ncbi:hypothetical protein JTE90_000716 [Oedothorax gibbosus]|uniref:Uncharacterized protein n=1 Tax=Oedothorax gibbosus TaxID=931172 RepID=A0AAV6UPV1_9ARAC|nr:hypothetical protein JTE90_000716 [Oedothorax gibbosus]
MSRKPQRAKYRIEGSREFTHLNKRALGTFDQRNNQNHFHQAHLKSSDPGPPSVIQFAMGDGAIGGDLHRSTEERKDNQWCPKDNPFYPWM